MHLEPSKSPQTLLTPQDAESLQKQLFELFKAADIDKNQLIDYNEFQTVINRFIPNTKEKTMKEMFSTLDGNNDGVISYAEFLDDDNFKRFLEYC